MEKHQQHKVFNIIPVYSTLPLILTVAMNMLAYYGGRLLAHHLPHHNLETPLDRMIPLVPWTLVIYWGCYLFWIINYILIAREDPESVYRFFAADTLARAICLFFFLTLPTTNIRPDIPSDNFWNAGMNLLYQIDSADNLFPSIHCLTSWFCYIGIRGRKELPRWYRMLSFMMAIAVFISTLTTRQHVLIDVAGGILLAEATWWAAGHTRMISIYKNILWKIRSLGRKKCAK